MNELINITYGNNDNPTVSGRDLHEKLGIGTAYKDWFPRMCEYGFEEGKDFNSLKIERVQNEGGRDVSREITDHALTLDMAKQLCMIQRSDIGRTFREYFLEIERAWNTPEQIMVRALRFANQSVERLKESLISLNTKIEQDKPKVLFADAVATAKTSILIGDLAKLIKQNGYDIGQKRLFQWMRDNGYLMKNGSSCNMPTQIAMDKKLFEVKESSIVKPDGSVMVSKTTKVTGTGQQYFINQFLSN